MKYISIDGESKEQEFNVKAIDFFLSLPNFLSNKDKLIPPGVVFLSIIKKCEYNSGMSGLFRWEEDAIPMGELSIIESELVSKGFLKVVVPDWVTNRSSWQIWKLEHLYGVPSGPHRELEADVEKYDKLYQQSLDDGDAQLAESYRLKKIESELKMSKFINSYLS